MFSLPQQIGAKAKQESRQRRPGESTHHEQRQRDGKTRRWQIEQGPGLFFDPMSLEHRKQGRKYGDNHEETIKIHKKISSLCGIE